MEEDSVKFVEWKEEFVSQERGRRIVHYILKDSGGKSILAVVGTERSLRHMVYVVAEEFLSYSGSNSLVQAGFKWRSRREVVDWLTSMLAKQHQADSPSGDSTQSLGSSELLSAKFFTADRVGRRVRNLKQSYSDIVWVGAAWTCGKQLKHYPAFRRNGTTIAVQSFVFVMAKEENRYVAYLEDMYEDKKGMKKVKVRWFHHSQEVKSIVRLRNSHPKEVYITPYTQVISVECVDGPAIVLTREHFEKYLEGFSDDLLGKLHLCCRQFRSNKIKPFDLRKLRGYHNQPLVSCLEPEIFQNSDGICGGLIGNRAKMLGLGDSVTKGGKRKMNHGAAIEGLEWKKSKSDNSDTWEKKLLSFKNGESRRLHIQHFKVDDKIELLCQDSGIRGCWFRCIVLEISHKQMKLQYKDLVDEDADGNLEEWVPAFRLAAPDKLGMRFSGRTTIRPCPPVSDFVDSKFEVGDPVDAWWSDGWWEGVVTAVKGPRDDNVQVYVPGENKFLNVSRNDLRVSRDWLDGKWVDIKGNPNILASINAGTEKPIVSTVMKDDHANDCALQNQLNEKEDKIADLPAPASSVNHPELVLSSDKDNQNDDQLNKDKDNNVSLQDMCCDGDGDGNDTRNTELVFSSVKDDQHDDLRNLDKSNDVSLQYMCCDGDGNDKNVGNGKNGLKEGESGTEDGEIGLKESESGTEDTENAAPTDEALEITVVT